MSGLKIRASDVFELPINHETLEIYCWQTKSTISLAECEEVVANIINSHDKLVDTVTEQEKVIGELVEYLRLMRLETLERDGLGDGSLKMLMEVDELLAKHKQSKGE